MPIGPIIKPSKPPWTRISLATAKAKGTRIAGAMHFGARDLCARCQYGDDFQKWHGYVWKPISMPACNKDSVAVRAVLQDTVWQFSVGRKTVLGQKRTCSGTVTWVRHEPKAIILPTFLHRNVHVSPCELACLGTKRQGTIIVLAVGSFALIIHFYFAEGQMV